MSADVPPIPDYSLTKWKIKIGSSEIGVDETVPSQFYWKTGFFEHAYPQSEKGWGKCWLKFAQKAPEADVESMKSALRNREAPAASENNAARATISFRFCPSCGVETANTSQSFCGACGYSLLATPLGTEKPLSAHQHALGNDIDNSRVFLLGIAPLLFLCINLAFRLSGASEGFLVGFLIAFTVNTVIVRWDKRYLKAQGAKASALLGTFLVPIYLARRSNRLSTTQTPLVVWIAAFVISIVGNAIVANNFTPLKMNALQTDIAHRIDKQGGSNTNVAVECPSKSVWSVHSTFFCTATAGDASVKIEVIVQNSAGHVTWQAVS